jgi:hypothetical protein
MSEKQFIKDCVVTIVADDYENIALILKWARRLARLRSVPVSQAQVIAGLEDAIKEG